MRTPQYRRRADRPYAFVEHKGHRWRLPGPADSAESLAAYHAFVQRVLSAAPVPIANPGFDVSELCDAYLDHARTFYRKDGRPTGEYDLIRAAIMPLNRLFAGVAVKDFGPRSMKDLRQAMVDRSWQRPGERIGRWSRGSINRQVGRLLLMFRWGVENELVPVAVYHALRTIRPLKRGKTTAPEGRHVAPVDPRHVAAVLPYLTPTLAAMVRLQQITGLRSESLVVLRPCDVDRSGDVWLYRPMASKGSRRLVVPLGPRAQAILSPYIERPADAFCFTPAGSELERADRRRAGRKTPLQPSQAKRRRSRTYRGRYNPRSYRRAVWYAIQAANRAAEARAAEENRRVLPGENVPHWHPHQLRHAVATEVRQRYGLECAQVVLGHATANVTEIYAERDLNLARRIAAEIG